MKKKTKPKKPPKPKRLLWTNEMAQLVRVLAARPDVEFDPQDPHGGRTDCLKLSSGVHTCTVARAAHVSSADTKLVNE